MIATILVELQINFKQKQGGGVALYINDKIDHEPQKDLIMSTAIIESVFIEIKKTFNQLWQRLYSGNHIQTSK